MLTITLALPSSASATLIVAELEDVTGDAVQAALGKAGVPIEAVAAQTLAARLRDGYERRPNASPSFKYTVAQEEIGSFKRAFVAPKARPILSATAVEPRTAMKAPQPAAKALEGVGDLDDASAKKAHLPFARSQPVRDDRDDDAKGEDDDDDFGPAKPYQEPAVVFALQDFMTSKAHGGDQAQKLDFKLGDYDALLGDDLIKTVFPSRQVALDILGLSALEQCSPQGDEVTLMFGVNQSSGQVVARLSSSVLAESEVVFAYSKKLGRITRVELHTVEKRAGAQPRTELGPAFIETLARGCASMGDNPRDASVKNDPQAHAELDLAAIKDEASGGYGYNVWPKLGVGANVVVPALAAMRDDGDAQFAKAHTWLAEHPGDLSFSQIFTIADRDTYRQMKELWGKHGGYIRATFDTRADSNSYKVLTRYIEDKRQ